MSREPRRSILCPNCRKLISADERACPHCGLATPGSWWKNNPWTRGLLDPEQLVAAWIWANVGLYVLSLLLDLRGLGISPNPFALLSPSQKALLLLGMTGTYPIGHLDRWWSLVSANYLHGGILHLAFNMIALRQIAGPALREYGVHRTLIVYTLGGVLGFWVSYLAGVPATLGASAAVCALIGAVLYYGRSRGGMYGQMVTRQIVGWLAGLFLFGFLVTGINNWAHGGGVAGGFVLAYLLGYQERRPENVWHKLLSAACVFVTLAVLVGAVASSLFYRFG